MKRLILNTAFYCCASIGRTFFSLSFFFLPLFFPSFSVLLCFVSFLRTLFLPPFVCFFLLSFLSSLYLLSFFVCLFFLSFLPSPPHLFPSPSAGFAVNFTYYFYENRKWSDCRYGFMGRFSSLIAELVSRDLFPYESDVWCMRVGEMFFFNHSSNNICFIALTFLS